MTPALAALCAFAAYFIAYRVYARFLSEKVFKLDPTRATPAHTMTDGVDYLPTKPEVLFGHHFASITGLAPMLGPAVAVIWGWLPALIWVVFGAIFIGCVHDFSALVLSARARGVSVGSIAEGVISSRARILFLLIIFFGVALAMGVFVFVISKLFGVYLVPPKEGLPGSGMEGYPQAVFPSLILMIIAAVSGFLLYKKKAPFKPVIIVGFVLSLLAIWGGVQLKEHGFHGDWWPTGSTWIYVLLIYAFLASVLPVWSLLQPRDFLNSLLLYLGLGLAYLGLFVGNPEFDAPAVIAHPEGAPSIFPFVFIIIACGAVSGFHGLVSSGTTSKQMDKETHAKPIGYGGMLGESLLGLLAVLACTAGFRSPETWHNHYESFEKISTGLANKLGGFIDGTTSFLTDLGLPHDLSAAVIAMVVVSFALTTLDSATRLLRFNIEELGQSLKIPFTGNRYLAAFLACLTIAFFAFYEVDGKPAALALWALFGTTNQLLAALTLMMVTLYLKHRKWPVWPAAIPAVLVMTTTIIAMVHNLTKFYGKDNLLFTVGLILLGLGIWLVVEIGLTLRQNRSEQGPEVQLENS